MLAKDPASRPSDAGVVAAELAALVPGLPAVPPSAFAETAVFDAGVLAAGDSGRGSVRPSPLPLPVPEQELLSIVLARAHDASPAWEADTLRPDEEVGWPTIFGMLSQLGAQAHLLLEGTLVVSLPSSASARDQVAQAARAALILHELWPRATVAVLTGRGTRKGQLAVGDVVDAGIGLIESGRADVDSPGILLDSLSEQLLSPRFRVQRSSARSLGGRSGGPAWLLGEDLDGDENRPLLGRPTPCLGREVELKSLEAALGACIEESETQVILVTGAGGLGKSRLRHEFLRRIAQSGRALSVLSGRGEPAAMPYAVLQQTLRRYLGLAGSFTAAAAAAPDEPRQRLDAWLASGAAVPPAVPFFREFMAELVGLPLLPGDGPARHAAHQDPRLLREQLRATFTEFLRRECRASPLLLVFDDMQWCDVGTIDLVDYALGQLPQQPIVVLALGRPETLTLHPTLWQSHSLRRITLGRLGRRACERLIRQVLEHARPQAVTDELVERLISQSDGNALYLEELIRSAAEPSQKTRPHSVLAMLQARIGVLPARQRQALLLASVLGQRFSVRDLSALLADSRGASAADTGALKEAELIEPASSSSEATDDDELAFRNDLIREAAYELVHPSERAQLHRQVALHLEATQPAASLRIAEHWQQAGEPGAALRWLGRAAKQALDGHDLDGAIRIAEQAVTAGAAGETLALLRALQAEAAFWQSRYPQCQGWALSALPVLRRGSAPFFRLLADALIASARLGDDSTVEVLRRDAVAVDAEPGAADEQLICLGRISFQFLMSSKLDHADALLGRLQALLPAGIPAAPLVRAQLAHALGMRAGIAGDIAGYAEKLGEVVAAFEEAGDLRNAAVESTTLSLLLLQLGQHAAAEEACRANLLRCEALGAAQATSYARLSLGFILVRERHELPQAQALLTSALAWYESIGHRRRVGLAHGYLALLHRAAERPHEAEQAAAQAVAHLGGTGGFLAWALALHADIVLENHGPDAALPDALAALEQLRAAGGGLMMEQLPAVVLAEALCRLQQDLQAAEIVEAALARMRVQLTRMQRASWRSGYLSLPEQQRLLRLARRLCPQRLFELIPAELIPAEPIPDDDSSPSVRSPAPSQESSTCTR